MHETGIEKVKPDQRTGVQRSRPEILARQATVMQLQRLAGNRAVSGMLARHAREISETSARSGGTSHEELFETATVQRQVIPSALVGHYRLKPSGAQVTSPGCAVTWTGKSVQLSGLLETYGPASTPDVAAQCKQAIENKWTGSFDDGSSISATTSVNHRDESTPADSNRSQIRVKDEDAPSNVHDTYYLFGAKTMELNLHAGQGDTDWTPAHEFGHMLGLPDHYSEGIVSSILSRWGHERTTSIDKGWDGNMMAVDHGTVDKRNTAEFLDTYATEFVMGGSDDTMASNDGTETWTADDNSDSSGDVSSTDNQTATA